MEGKWVGGPQSLDRAPIRQHPESAHRGVEQKMWALADQSETKARDVFDLELLFRRRVSAGHSLGTLSPEHSTKAAEKATEFGHEGFLSEVIPFLDPDIAEVLGAEEVWYQMREYVGERLLEVSQNREERRQ
jgi:hypothetical protein